MCGIVGFCNYKKNYLDKKDEYLHILRNMRDSIKHRGEDAKGHYIEKNVFLGHARLSIRDLSENGTQPFTAKIGDNLYTICYNGEIYNTEDLKKQLKNYTFKTTTDTEVILYLFIEYGEKCVEMLNGIFSFAIYNKNKEELYLFRDRLGIKPLFYTIKEDTLVFASEIKALFKFKGLKPEIDKESLKQIFGLGPARTEGNGVFKNIKELKSGHFAVFNKYGFKQLKYWGLISKEHKDTYEQTVEKVHFLLKDAIERQLVSDVDICSFLSGGIDSSIVTAVAVNYLKRHNKILNTFSFDFKENDIYFKSNSFQPERDRPYVDIMVKKI